MPECWVGEILYLCTNFPHSIFGISSNGRTEAFEAFNRGPTPCIPARRKTTVFERLFFVHELGYRESEGVAI